MSQSLKDSFELLRQVRTAQQSKGIARAAFAAIDGSPRSATVVNRSSVSPSLAHSKLADRLDTHREATTRELRVLAKRDILRQSRRELLIVDIEGLSRMVRPSSGEIVFVYAAPNFDADLHRLAVQLLASD